MTLPAGIYAELLNSAPQSTGRAFRRFDAPEGMVVAAFVDGSSRLPGVSLSVRRDLIPASFQLPRMQGATLTVGVDASPSHVGVTYDLSAAHTRFVDVFVDLAARLIVAVQAEETASKALRTIERLLASWARFFDARGSDGLGRAAQLGLIGELLCFQQIARLTTFGAATEAWVGAAGGPHDFAGLGGAIECKLSTSSQPERFRISSERQLDDSVVPCLLLFTVLAQEVASGDVTLPQLVDDLRRGIVDSAPAAEPLFEERLTSTGYTDADRAAYQVRLTIRQTAFLRVSGPFPRIVPADLRPGVFAVSYDIPWTAVAPFREPLTTVAEIICDN